MLLLLNSALLLNRSCAPYSTLLFRYQGNRGSSELMKAGTESHVGGGSGGGVLVHIRAPAETGSQIYLEDPDMCMKLFQLK